MREKINSIYRDSNFGAWRGYRLIAVDGSSLRLSSSLANAAQEIFTTF